MTREQRLSHIKKVASTAVSDTRELVDEESCRSHTSLSADILCLAANIGLPVTALQAIGDKARELLETAGAITPAPGQSPDACMVLSRTGKRPHLVTPKRNGGFACDDECPQYRSSGVCSHVVATL